MNVTDLLSAAGCLFGLVGVVLGVIFYRKAKRVKRLSFDTRSFGLLSDATASLAGFRATYHDTDLVRLTAARILFWNSGTDIVESTDIAEKDPLRFELPDDCQIVSANVSGTSASTNNVGLCTCLDHSNAVGLTFDYLAPREGCLISLLHTGNEDSPIRAMGTLKGEGTPREYIPSRLASWWGTLSCFLGGVLATQAFFLGFYGFTWFAIAACSAGALLAIVISIVAGVRLSRKTGSALDKRFRGDFTPSEFARE